MTALENLLRQVSVNGGREIRLVPDQQMVMQADGGDRAVPGYVSAQTAGSIEALLKPVLTDPIRQALSSGPVQFRVRLKDMGSVQLLMERRLGGLHAQLRLPDPVPPEAPAEDEEAHVAQNLPKAPAEEAPAPQPLRRAPVAETGSVDPLLIRMQEAGASDLHLSAGARPMVRLDGEMQALADFPALTAADIRAVLQPIMPERNREEFERLHDTDFAYEIAGRARYRANCFVDRRGMGAVFRIIPSRILTVEDLRLPKAVVDFCHLPKGLVLVTGPTGSGKSTTLAAMIDYINRKRRDHVITIEDPIEFVHENKECLINQRQVGEHTSSFKHALRAALREDPDIVLVGELRDLETMEIALETAETGHLVFGTLHTSSAASTVDRIIDQFPADRQAQIRVMLSESLKGVVSQALLKRLGGGRVAALEVMVGLPAVSNLIREGKVFQIPSVIQTGRQHGMMMMNDALLDLVRQKVVAPREAWAKSPDRSSLLTAFGQHGIDASWAKG